MFDHLKWDPQIGDTAILADFPLLMGAAEWGALCGQAEALAAETLTAESLLATRPDLLRALGIPAPITRLWAQPGRVGGTSRDVRLMRFDFHPTPDGWRVSEVNSDVPGGLNEASGYTRLMAEQSPGTRPGGDPTAATADAIAAALPKGLVAFVHATAYTDDHQVMAYLARQVARAGLDTRLVSPAHLRWQDGAARLVGGGEAVDYVVRFFPGEWLPNLRRGWEPYFTGARVPMCNPGAALLSQSKRLPLVWDALGVPLRAWRAALPETRDPRSFAQMPGDEWVLKPAFGRVGEDIHIAGLTPAKARAAAWGQARRHPNDWLVQRRFLVLPVESRGALWYPSIGVYTVNGHACGVYARMDKQPLIHATAPDVALLIAD